MSSAIIRKIEERRARAEEIEACLTALHAQIAELEREHAIVNAERRAYADALDIVGTKVKRTVASGERTSGTTRALSDDWRAILGEMARFYPRAVTNDQIVAFAARSAIVLRRDNLRSQMMLYKNKGLVEPEAPGVSGAYRITEAGAQIIGVELKNEAPAEAGAQIRDVEHRGGPAKPDPDDPFASLQRGDLDDEIPF